MEMEFKCTLCRKEFYKRKYLKAHEARVHTSEIEITKNERFECKTCHKKFGSRSSLWRHNTSVHNKEKAKNVICQEPDCNESFINVCGLREHLTSEHRLDAYSDCVKLQFKCETGKSIFTLCIILSISF